MREVRGVSHILSLLISIVTPPSFSQLLSLDDSLLIWMTKSKYLAVHNPKLVQEYGVNLTQNPPP